MKYIFGLVLGVALTLTVVLSYFYFKGGQYAPGLSTTQPSSPSPTIALGTPTPTPKPTKTVSGGGVLSFPKYTLTVPTDWSDTKEILSPDAEKVVLKKGNYQISITQGGFGGAICLFPGDADVEGPSGRYDFYVDLTSKSGNLFRRVGVEGGGGFSICEKTQYGWNAPSSYGHISILTPKTPEEAMVEEIDSIISSF